MYRYLLTGNFFSGEMEFKYDGADLLQFFENRTDIPGERFKIFVSQFPASSQALKALVERTKSLTLAVVAVEITFKQFYDAYAYKVGNKQRAEKLWNALSITDRILAFQHIAAYDRFLAPRPKMEKLYPEAYLNQRRWENELPGK